jgi:archaellum component FlaC
MDCGSDEEVERGVMMVPGRKITKEQIEKAEGNIKRLNSTLDDLSMDYEVLTDEFDTLLSDVRDAIYDEATHLDNLKKKLKREVI